MIVINKNPLSALSDSALLKRLDDLVHKERQTTLEIINHIIEIDRRKLYLGRGYGSLYEYCTLHLGYSESAAMRRIRTARAIREFPEIYGMLSKNELSLTNVCILAEILNEKNKKELLAEARCKSKRQMEAIVARYKPGKNIKDRVRTVFVKTLTETAMNNSASGAGKAGDLCETNSGEKQDVMSMKNWVKSTTAGGGKNPAANDTFASCACKDKQKQKMIIKKKFKLEFAVDPVVMKKLEEAKALLSTKCPQGVTLEMVLDVALDTYLDKNSPKRKIERRKKRKAKQKARQKNMPAGTKANEAPVTVKSTQKREKKKAPDTNQPSRHIPAAVWDKVFERDKGRCTFVGAAGKRCNSTWNLQVDHVVPFARGGKHSIENLRLLCAAHNMHEAKRVYGSGFIEERMSRRE